MRDLLQDLKVPHQTDVPLGPLTSYGVGGPAKVLARPSSVQQLSMLAVKCHDRGVPVYVLGSGANLLVADEGVDGVVVTLADPCFTQVKTEGQVMTVGAGFDLARLVLDTAKAGLGGLECLAGIPASVGGAVHMNAGGIFGEIGRAVRRVRVMGGNGQTYYRDRDDLVFGYRTTNIIAPFILEVEFDLTPDDPEALMRQVKEIYLYKKNSQPLAADSAGCAFKNPDPDASDGASAGKLIDQAGLKGHRVGRASVSRLHANFIVTDDGCTAADVLAVLDHVHQTVLEKYGISLEREVVCWP
ncbi:MAG: UDP-N-acetylmuramate dehydrogenase [Phycisphaeraceae bacterium]